MMEGFIKFMQASEDERIAAFERAAAAHDTIASNVEKDLWVCWTLDLLFNRRSPDTPRLFFKGGTSLSKSFGLIRRFSEDIDIGVFKEDIGAPSEEDIATIPTITQRQKAIEGRIDGPSKQFFSESLKPQIEKALAEFADKCGFPIENVGVELDVDKRTQQQLPEVLLVRYPTLFTDTAVVKVVKIEGGARPRSIPAETTTIAPYLASALDQSFGLTVPNVLNIAPERTFWEKVLILHALREMTDKRTADGDPKRPIPSLNRISRHYYDVSQIWTHPKYGEAAASDPELAEECRWHKDLMYRAPDHRYDRAIPGTYRLVPSPEMRTKLAADYRAMSGMIFGTPPTFDEVMERIQKLETFLNDELKARLAAGAGPKL